MKRLKEDPKSPLTEKERSLIQRAEKYQQYRNKFYQDNPDIDKDDELISYLIMVEDQIFWESQKEYIQMLDLVVSKNITLDQFFTQFCGLRSSNLKSSRMRKNNLEEEACGIRTQSNKIDFQLNPESSEFTKIIPNLHSWIDLYDPDITLKINLKQPELIGYGISEEFLKFIIEEDFLPLLEKYCNKS